MKLRWILAVLMAAMSLVAVGSAASANTVFKVSNNPWTTYFGTLTIDTVNGLVVSGDMWVKFRLPKPPIGQRRCPACGLPMLLVCIEPTDNAGEDERTFECSKCAYAETMIVKFR